MGEEVMSAWWMLAIAIVSEVIATSALKASDSFSRLVPSVLVVLGYGSAFWWLAQVVRKLDLGVVYAIWCGVGMAVIAAIGVAIYGEALSMAKVGGIILIITGTVLLSFSGVGH